MSKRRLRENSGKQHPDSICLNSKSPPEDNILMCSGAKIRGKFKVCLMFLQGVGLVFFFSLNKFYKI